MEKERLDTNVKGLYYIHAVMSWPIGIVLLNSVPVLSVYSYGVCRELP